MPFGSLGFGEIVLILLVILIVFGPRRLPELGGALGKGIREFKRSVSDIRTEITDAVEEPKRELQSVSRPAVTSGADAPAVRNDAARTGEAERTDG